MLWYIFCKYFINIFFYYDYFKPESQRQNPNHKDRALNKKTSIRPPAAKSPKKISFFIIIS